MKKATGVLATPKKDGTALDRSSITIHGKHISLGSFSQEELAVRAYEEAKQIRSSDITPEEYNSSYHVPCSCTGKP